LKAFAQAAAGHVKDDSIQEHSKSEERRDQPRESFSDFPERKSKIVQAGPELSVRDEHATNLSQRDGDAHVRQGNVHDYPVERTIGEGQFLGIRNHKPSSWELTGCACDRLVIDVGPDEVPLSWQV